MATARQDERGTGSHLAVVDALARELQLPVDRVAGAYLEEVSRLEASARIKTFVSVLAVGKVRSELRQRQPATAGLSPESGSAADQSQKDRR